jgi:CheY-like chemotaxis protein
MATKGTDYNKRVVVLVIEDDRAIRLLVSDFIADSGFEALEAADADEAVQILESRDDIRAVFTDINMPGSMDGLKLAHTVRDRWPSIHIIVTSGYRRVAKGEIPLGSFFFVKPYNPEHIVAVLRGIGQRVGHG